MTRPAHRPSRRSHILDASLELFVDEGVSAVSVAEIAERAGMTPAAVYYHFPSKAEVLLELVDRIGAQLLERFQDARAADVGAWVAHRYDAIDRWRHDTPAELALYLRASVGISTSVEALRRRQHGQLLATAAKVVTRARRDLEPVEVQVVALGLVTLLLEAFEGDAPAARADVIAIAGQLLGSPARPRGARLRRK